MAFFNSAYIWKQSLIAIRDENDLLFLFKSLNFHVDSTVCVDKFIFSTSRETRNSGVFAPPTARNNLGLNSPFFRMMSLFDDLNLSSVNLNGQSLNNFKSLISNLILIRLFLCNNFYVSKQINKLIAINCKISWHFNDHYWETVDVE